MKTPLICCLLALLPQLSWGQQHHSLSSVWVADNADGTYTNPILYADYSDPDACRVGEDYYLTSSSFNCVPALQILHSKDLVNWTIVSAAVPYALPPVADTLPQHGNRVWAPSIRYHEGMFYIFWGDPDQGVFMTCASDVQGVWSEPILVKAAQGVIDSTPLWDDDGRVYLVHAYAGSRAGLKSVLAVCELSADATKAITPSRIIFDGHEAYETCEGPKFYKRGGYYYIFYPAGGVQTGFQMVGRSQSVYGPYEHRMVLAQGNTPINGPHQGAWVDTPTGEDWFLHFQDIGAYGRVVHLQPMRWADDWPVIGNDADGDGCGEPVLRYRKPNVGHTYPIATPQESDEFDANTLGLQWQWHANPDERWHFADAQRGMLRLYSFAVPKHYCNLWDVPNLLLQKTTAPQQTITTRITFCPTAKYVGERTGLVVMGLDYAALVLENGADGLTLRQVVCQQADKGTPETLHEAVALNLNTLYLRVQIYDTGELLDLDHVVKCTFSYSTNGESFTPIGAPFTAKEGKWIGTKVGLFCTRPDIVTNDGGWCDVDWYRVSK